MYKTIIMPVDVFEMELSDKAIRHAEFLAQDDGVIHLLHVLPGSASLSLHRFAADVRRFEEHLQHEAEERRRTEGTGNETDIARHGGFFPGS